MLIIKPLNGASNLSHELSDLRTSMCKYVVLLDNDEAGKSASDRAKASGLLKESQVKFTICNGSPQAEFEDCLKPDIYTQKIMDEFSVNLKVQAFKGNKKWSDRVKEAFLSQGSEWNDRVEQKVKECVATAIPDKITTTNIDDVVISQKSGFLQGLATAVELLIQE